MNTNNVAWFCIGASVLMVVQGVMLGALGFAGFNLLLIAYWWWVLGRPEKKDESEETKNDSGN